jgi:hypothetical protein
VEFEEQQELDITTTKTSMPQDSNLDNKGGQLMLLHQDVNTIKLVQTILDTGSRQSIMTYQGAKRLVADTTAATTGSYHCCYQCHASSHY